MKICVVTSYSASAEPRAPRHAVAAKRAFPDGTVLFVDLAPVGAPPATEPAVLQGEGVERLTVRFPTRSGAAVRLIARKLASRLARAWFTASGHISDGVFGDRHLGLAVELKRLAADAYICHNIETLLPTVRAAPKGAAIVFDCMEFYSDMGDGQSRVQARAARVLEQRYLGNCALVLASSDDLADALADVYRIARPLTAYNVPPLVNELPARRGGGMNLYWRNSVVGFGQRGLDDALLAMRQVPSEVRLYLQGRPPIDGGRSIRERCGELGIGDRVEILPPYAPADAITSAAPYDVGLCLERKGPRNHDLTVSNKMFDYHMAGLAVVASDLPGLRRVISRSEGGLLYHPGDPTSLADAIRLLHTSPDRLSEYQANARRFALNEGNLETLLPRLTESLRLALSRSPNAAGAQQVV